MPTKETTPKETKSPARKGRVQKSIVNPMTGKYLKFILECVDHPKSHIDFTAIARDQGVAPRNIQRKFERAKAHAAALVEHSTEQAEDNDASETRGTRDISGED